MGYRFISDKFQQLLENFEKTNNPEGDFQQQRRRAVALISEIAGNEPKLFYVRRKEAGKNPRGRDLGADNSNRLR